MRIYQILGLVLLLNVTFSCHKKYEPNYNAELATEYERKYTLEKGKPLIIELDSTQGFFENSMSHFQNNGTGMLSLFNKLTGTIHYYDISTGERVHKLQLQNEGPDGVGTNVNLLTVMNISLDSVFIINGWNEEAYLMNGNGKKIKTYKFTETELYENEGPFWVPISNDNRPIFLKNKVYVNCRYNADKDYSKKKVLLEIDLESGDINGHFTPPDEYSLYCWGVEYSTNIFSTYNRKSKEFIMSFGVDHFVYSKKLDGEYFRKYLGSEYFSELSVFSNNVKDYMERSSYEKRANHSLMSPKYYKIVYLPNSQIYLRETFLPRTEEELLDGGMGIKKTFIIADAELNKVGEFKIPDNTYYSSNYFLASGGIYMSDLNFYYNNEGQMKFDLFVPKRIDK